jgi:hypothetical protein
MIHLVRDVLDTQVLDRDEKPVGKVDGIALELRAGEPARVAWLEVDGACAWRRLGERFGRWAAAAARRWRGEAGAYRFTWAQVRPLDVDLQIDASVEDTSAFALERWLRDKLRVIPGGQSGEGK